MVDVREDEVVLLGDGDVAGRAMRSVGECQRRDMRFQRPDWRVLRLVDQMAAGRVEGQGIRAGDRAVWSDQPDPAGAIAIAGGP